MKFLPLTVRYPKRRTSPKSLCTASQGGKQWCNRMRIFEQLRGSKTTPLKRRMKISELPATLACMVLSRSLLSSHSYKYIYLKKAKKSYPLEKNLSKIRILELVCIMSALLKSISKTGHRILALVKRHRIANSSFPISREDLWTRARWHRLMALLAYSIELIIKTVEVQILKLEELSSSLERIQIIPIKAIILVARKFLTLKVWVQWQSRIWNHLQGR